MPKKFSALILFFALLTALAGFADAAETVRNVRIDDSSDRLRLILDLSGSVKYTVSTLDKPDRLVVDIRDSRVTAKLADLPLADTQIKRVRSGIRNGSDSRLVFELTAPMKVQSRLFNDNGMQLAIELTPRNAKLAQRARKESSVKEKESPATEAVLVRSKPAATDNDSGEDASADSAPRAKATKVADGGGQRDVIIAIDAGHGGDDPGAIGAGRLQEKQVALAIARALADMFERERGYKPVLTRKGDYFLPLKTRRDLARKAQADLMVSIHADAFDDRSAEGGSVFALSNRGATSTMAAFLAESENNADAIGGVSVEGKDDDLVKVLTDLSLTATMDSSLRIGKHVLNSMSGIARLHSQRVEQAAFVVLKSPDTPSILVETGFVSNPKEAKRLSSAEYQQQIARAIFKGVDRYFRMNPPPNTYLAWAKRNGASQRASNDNSLATAAP